MKSVLIWICSVLIFLSFIIDPILKITLDLSKEWIDLSSIIYRLAMMSALLYMVYDQWKVKNNG